MIAPTPDQAASGRYIGRFAPSPTGPLHFGSLVAALASYLDAKHNNGLWLLRMEDLDTPRCSSTAADDIVRTLDIYGLHWDGSILYQSQRQAAYQEALEQLNSKGLVYPCTCSRKEIADSALRGIDGLVYPGHCRPAPQNTRALKPIIVAPEPGKKAAAWRLNTQLASDILFEDALQGTVHQQLARQIGDFVLLRADGFFAYQLAVVVDDQAQGITHVVRGADLLESTPRQIFLQRQLGFLSPHYLHTPIACNSAGEKLSKQTLAPAISCQKKPGENFSTLLVKALQFLGQETPPEADGVTPEYLLEWAAIHWSRSRIPRQRQRLAIA